jgi:PAT family beta-lactamase induction signal transducer AmpG
MGFSSGLPFLLTLSLLQAWLQQAGVDLTVIGIAALVGLPYTFKFLWAPLMDCWVPPFLGRRRGWLAISQVLLMAAIATLGLCDPNDHPLFLGATAFLVAFFSASQDIVIDAYRHEDLKDKELGLGSSLAVSGYRVGMLLASGGGLILADHIPFSQVYLVMAACQGLGLATTLLAHEPQTNEHPPKSLKEAVVAPFVEYFTRNDLVWGLGVLTLVLLYKLGDTMTSALTIPFYLDLGFSKTEIGTVVKLFGFWATVAGGLVGGVLMLRLGNQPRPLGFRRATGRLHRRLRRAGQARPQSADPGRRDNLRKHYRRHGHCSLRGLHGLANKQKLHRHPVRTAQQPDGHPPRAALGPYRLHG